MEAATQRHDRKGQVLLHIFIGNVSCGDQYNVVNPYFTLFFTGGAVHDVRVSDGLPRADQRPFHRRNLHDAAQHCSKPRSVQYNISQNPSHLI